VYLEDQPSPPPSRLSISLDTNFFTEKFTKNSFAANASLEGTNPHPTDVSGAKSRKKDVTSPGGSLKNVKTQNIQPPQSLQSTKVVQGQNIQTLQNVKSTTTTTAAAGSTTTTTGPAATATTTADAPSFQNPQWKQSIQSMQIGMSSIKPSDLNVRLNPSKMKLPNLPSGTKSTVIPSFSQRSGDDVSYSGPLSPRRSNILPHDRSMPILSPPRSATNRTSSPHKTMTVSLRGTVVPEGIIDPNMLRHERPNPILSPPRSATNRVLSPQKTMTVSFRRPSAPEGTDRMNINLPNPKLKTSDLTISNALLSPRKINDSEKSSSFPVLETKQKKVEKNDVSAEKPSFPISVETKKKKKE
jgi:hypothetical protein